MAVLAIDPGDITGIVVLLDWRQVPFARTVDGDNFYQWQDARHLILDYPWAKELTDAVIERRPLKGYGSGHAWLGAGIFALNLGIPKERIHWVSPGEWKPLKGTLRDPNDEQGIRLTSHTRDALYMGRYWMRAQAIAVPRRSLLEDTNERH